MAKKKRSNRFIYLIVILVVVVAVLVVLAKNRGKREISVEIAEAKKTEIIEKVSASGAVQPVTEVKLSPDVAGEIIELNVEEGDSVIAGDLLVKIRPDNFESALDRAKASYNQQQANLASAQAAEARAEATFLRARQEYDRQKKLKDEQVISDAEWELAQQNFKVAENDLKSAKESVKAARFVVISSKATVEEAEENVRLTKVFAPMTGIVSKLSVEKGERVVGTQQMAGTEMLRIADLNKMEVRVNVNENDIIRINLRDTVLIDVDSYAHLEKEFKGIVTAIANTANDKVSADAITEFEVRIEILNSSYQDLVNAGTRYPFRPGMTASVDIITDKKVDILTVPLASVTTRNARDLERGRNRGEEDDEVEVTQVDNRDEDEDDDEEMEVVFVVGAENEVMIVEVETGISDYDNIEIKKGITNGDKIVSGPFLVVSKRLKNGDKVKEQKSRRSRRSKSDSDDSEE